MHCEEVARALSAAADGGLLDQRAGAHVSSCLRCQAELAQYRRLRRGLRALRDEVHLPGPWLAADVIAALGDPPAGAADRSLPGRRRSPAVGRLAVATAAAAGAGVALLRRQRGARATG